MTEPISYEEAAKALLGEPAFGVWDALRALIDERYDMDRLWGKGGRDWVYEYKLRRGGKTLCAFYIKESRFVLLLVFGKEERRKFEESREAFSEAVRSTYDGARTYHDGKWMWFTFADKSCLADVEKLLAIKRKPNRKAARGTV